MSASAGCNGRVLVSGDMDFGMLLARSGATEPSFLLFCQRGERRAAQQARLVLENLVELQVDLEAGSVVVFTDDRARVRRLPLPPK